MSSRTWQAGRFGKQSHGQAAAFKFMDMKASDIRHIHSVWQLPPTEFHGGSVTWLHKQWK